MNRQFSPMGGSSSGIQSLVVSYPIERFVHFLEVYGNEHTTDRLTILNHQLQFVESGFVLTSLLRLHRQLQGMIVVSLHRIDLAKAEVELNQTIESHPIGCSGIG